MLKRLLSFLPKGATILTITTFASYVTGLVRDRIFAQTFGLSRTLDVYNSAFIIPDLLFTILIASALSAAFIPVFSSLLARDKKAEAEELANSVLTSTLFAIIFFGAAAAISMPWLVDFIAPEFSIEEKKMLIQLSRFMLISPIIMTVSNCFGSMLTSYKRFLAYGISPLLYNVGIIGGALLSPRFGIMSLVVGTLVGACFHLAPRLLIISKTAFSFRPKINLRDKNFHQVVKLMIPKMIGHPIEQLTFLSFNRIASRLVVGSITAVSFARNFQSVPVSLFGISISFAALPVLSECVARGDTDEFKKHFKKALFSILAFTVPSAAVLYFLSDLPIRILLGGGNFSDEHILRTAQVLSVFALSVPTESLVHLLARSFYAYKNTIIPVLVSVIGFAIAVGYASLKAPLIGIVALPYGFFLGSFVEVLLLWLLFHRRLKTVPRP